MFLARRPHMPPDKSKQAMHQEESKHGEYEYPDRDRSCAREVLYRIHQFFFLYRLNTLFFP